MILAKTPLRIPLAGGLSDLKDYANQFGGLTVSATIDKYIFVAVKGNYNNDHELQYLNTHEKTRDVEHIRHNHIREAIKICDLSQNYLSLSIMNDLPHEGGLGSSGALSAALLTSLYSFANQPFDNQKIIQSSSKLEMEVLESASGYQDHTVTHLGGFQYVRYSSECPESIPHMIPEERIQQFLERFMLFYTGFHAKTRPSLEILTSKLTSRISTIHEIKSNAQNLIVELQNNNLDRAGECIQKHQDLKQSLPGSFENTFVVETMTKAKECGVYAQFPGGKAGAFLLVYRPEGVQEHQVRQCFQDLDPIPFHFEPAGTQVVKI